MLKRFSMVVFGRVQGVGYRYFAQDAAEALGISGWVRNNYDGTVEIEAQAEEEWLDQFQDRLRDGPPLAHIANIQKCEMPPVEGESSFEVR